ncbi:hypothetical protein Tco_0157301 [Tanacetum coccineum]
MASLDRRLNPLYAIKECSSCGTLYTGDCGCSKGGLEDKILVPIPDLSRRPLKIEKICLNCGDPVHGLYCRQCALIRKTLEFFFQDFQDTSKSSDDDTNFCYQGISLSNRPRCKIPRKVLHKLIRNVLRCRDSLDGIHLSNEALRDHPRQRPQRTILFLVRWERFSLRLLCGVHHSPVVYKQRTRVFNQNLLIISTEAFTEFSQQRIFLCCENCGGPHETFQCQPMNEDYYHEQNPCYDSNSFGFDQFQPPQYTVNHPIFNAQNDFLNSQNKLMEQMTSMCDMVGQFIQKKEEEKRIEEEQAAKDRYWKIPVCYDDDDDEESSIPLKDIISELPPCVAITPDSPKTNSLIMEDEHLDTIPETESDELIKSSVKDLVQIPSESEDSSEGECDLPPYDDSSKNHDLTFSNPLFDINEDFTSSDESFFEEDVPNENFKIFSNPLFDLDEEITSTKVDQIDDEVLENTNSIPPGIEYLCFNAESDLLESLLHRDTSINDSQKIDSLLDEFAGELTLPHSIPPGIDDVNLDPEGDILFLESLLYDNSSPRPPEEFNSENSIESFPPSHIPVEDSDSLIEEINIFLDDDDSIPPGIESDDFDS